jgi:hypothetical protein
MSRRTVDCGENTLPMDRALDGHPLPDAFDVDAPAAPLTGRESPAHLQGSVRAVHDALPDGRLAGFAVTAGRRRHPRRAASPSRTRRRLHPEP